MKTFFLLLVFLTGCTITGDSINDTIDNSNNCVINDINDNAVKRCAKVLCDGLSRRIEVDSFEIYTDSETWTGNIHPHIALEEYRQIMGIDAKLVVVGMVSNGFSIANPHDPGMLDVVGFDTVAPAVMADFIRQ